MTTPLPAPSDEDPIVIYDFGPTDYTDDPTDIYMEEYYEDHPDHHYH